MRGWACCHVRVGFAALKSTTVLPTSYVYFHFVRAANVLLLPSYYATVVLSFTLRYSTAYYPSDVLLELLLLPESDYYPTTYYWTGFYLGVNDKDRVKGVGRENAAANRRTLDDSEHVSIGPCGRNADTYDATEYQSHPDVVASDARVRLASLRSRGEPRTLRPSLPLRRGPSPPRREGSAGYCVW